MTSTPQKKETRSSAYESSSLPVLKVEKRSPASELVKHSSGGVERFVFADSKNNPTGNLYVALRPVGSIEKHTTSESRTHSVDSLMMFIGTDPDLKGLEVEVCIDDERFRLNSPASVYVRAHQTQSYSLISGSGFYEKIVLAPGGDYNKVTS